MATTKVFPSIFEIASKVSFWVFFNQKSNFLLEKTFCMQNLIFCGRNVFLDALMLDFFLFRLITFFENARNSFFLWPVYVCLDQCRLIS